ncbi:hypothetical protein HS088_TW21G00517 [Tripterygium wilfordii]|uniref:Chlororespiratory reduction 41 n=1 Tax=Tripterygium wilfordii TaxID=458696 RepID=A0A7J7C2I9_TRIWF|nr:uncharacterized protein LOC119989203 [Tripterygium wilfordii]KAF5728370.1 hypothetical protein HS088_TW21G00517 [Tripterygium wilfordii]
MLTVGTNSLIFNHFFFHTTHPLSMASIILHLNHLHHSQISTILTNPSHKTHYFSIKCTSISNSPLEPDLPYVPSTTTETDLPFISPSELTTDTSFPIEKRRRADIVRDKKSRTGLVKPEPPNYEIGWKRTKEINLEKPIGYEIMDFLDKLLALMDREYGSTELLEKVGEIVAERAREEAEELRDEGKVEERMVTELFRVLKLIEMDLAMVKAAVKEETLSERLEQAKSRCRQAILVAKSF